MNLNKMWKQLKTNASTENVLMTVSDIVNYYSRGRININPSYQRSYRWTNEQKTKFIESLLLKYPIPPIITIKTENDLGLAEYEIIDGVQRLSTIFEFMKVKPVDGQYVDNINQKLDKLEGANSFIEINGKDWDDFKLEQFDFIFESSTLLFTNFVTNDEDIKYEMFERLNSLSTELSPQEIRSSIIAMKDANIFKNIDKEVFDISKEFLNKGELAKRDDLALFIEFSLIKRYEEYIDIINEKIKFLKDINSKNKDRHFDLFLTSYVRVVKIQELLEDLANYKEFISLNKDLYFKKYDEDKDSTVGNVIRFFFEVLSFIYFKSKDQINKEFYKDNFNQNYADIMKNKVKRNNPNARARFEIAKKIVEGYEDGCELF